MKKTTVYLEPEVDSALARIAERDGVTKAEVIRRSLRETVRSAPRQPRLSVGVFEGPKDLSDDLDRHLGEILSKEYESMT